MNWKNKSKNSHKQQSSIRAWWFWVYIIAKVYIPFYQHSTWVFSNFNFIVCGPCLNFNKNYSYNCIEPLVKLSKRKWTRSENRKRHIVYSALSTNVLTSFLWPNSLCNLTSPTIILPQLSFLYSMYFRWFKLLFVEIFIAILQLCLRHFTRA